MTERDFWRKCGPCKKPIAYASTYYVCSVSSCKKNVFCSKDCWSAHVPVMRHKEAWPEEMQAPSAEEVSVDASAEQAREARRRRIVAAAGEQLDDDVTSGDLPEDVLIVASKLKQYIKAKSQMNTSAQVMNRLSEIVRIYCDEAIKRAREDGRKTVLDRDFIL